MIVAAVEMQLELDASRFIARGTIGDLRDLAAKKSPSPRSRSSVSLPIFLPKVSPFSASTVLVLSVALALPVALRSVFLPHPESDKPTIKTNPIGKREILFERNRADFDSHSEKYQRHTWYASSLMLTGELK